jgi:hypothetical protein
MQVKNHKILFKNTEIPCLETSEEVETVIVREAVPV